MVDETLAVKAGGHQLKLIHSTAADGHFCRGMDRPQPVSESKTSPMDKKEINSPKLTANF